MKLSEMVYMTDNAKRFFVKSSQIPNGTSDLPIDDIQDGSTVTVVDTKTTYVLYQYEWYELD